MIEIKTQEKSPCILCSEDTYKPNRESVSMCDFCGNSSAIVKECDNGHTFCANCSDLHVVDSVKAKCLKYNGYDPIELAVEIMNSPLVKMHGAEHHFIVPAVLLTCVYNKEGKGALLTEHIEKIDRRSHVETPSQCSYDLKMCGAAIGSGVFLSVYLDRELSDEDQWSPANGIVAEGLKKIAAAGGPRCCKRDTYLTIQASVEFLKNNFAIDLPMSEAKCTFSLRNKSCKREDCNFYNIGYSIM